MNSVLIAPLLILILAIVYRIFPPKKINWFYGYRTKLSMKNLDTWHEANRFASNLLLICSVAYLCFVMLCVLFIHDRERQMLISTIVLFFYLFGIVFITEWRLKKLFNESGKRIIENKK